MNLTGIDNRRMWLLFITGMVDVEFCGREYCKNEQVCEV